MPLILRPNRGAPFAPAQGGGGALNFGDSFTVTGSGFGTKAHSAPNVWDYGQAGAGNLDSQWDGASPSTIGTGNMRNYAPGTNSVTPPHSHIQNILAGAHNAPSERSGIVGAWVDVTIGGALTYPFYIYGEEHFHIDTRWVFASQDAQTPGDDNFKRANYVASHGGGIDSGTWYEEYGPPPEFSSTSVSPAMHIVDDDSNFDTPSGNWAGTASPNPTQGWVKVQRLWKITNAANGGFVRVWNNGDQDLNVTTRTDNSAGTQRSYQLGSYARQYPYANNWRYYSGVFVDIDKNPGRFVLTNNATYSSSTKWEVLSYTAYSDTSVTLICNPGVLGAGTWFLHHLNEVNGNQLNLRTVTCNA